MVSRFLFATPSALEGFGRLVDFAGTLNEYNTSPDEETADTLAMMADWRATGEDLRAAMREFDQPHKPR